MSVLSRYLVWFGDQSLSVQVVSTALLFGLLFVFGLYTLGLGPLVVIMAVMLEHWYREGEYSNAESDD